MRFSVLVLLGGLAACGSEGPKLSGQVVDLWGSPVAGALVLMEGPGNQRTHTDSNGSYTLDRLSGEQRFRAGHKAYIQGDATFTVTENSASGPNFKLYDRPSENGFYVIGTGKYTAVEKSTVEAKGTEVQSYYGLKVDGVDIQDKQPTILFHTDLSKEEIQQLDLELRKLSYVDEAMLPGPLGAATPAQIELFIASNDRIPFELEATGSRNDYLITLKTELEAGAYAFHTLGLLDPDDAKAFSRIPKSHRQAFPFAVID
jgi:hypothetical protein